ncbi:tyrosine-type recombinase/integrase [Pelagibacterium sp.]|uniref:tyrosine-type recombinase/integrase n=1 Tax=Pelagibacterium sp. TaxID=1967288 RepID=UPI003A954C2A
MSKNLGARLYLKPAEYGKDGKLRKRATWIIKDGSLRRVTGCAAHEREQAEKALSDYLAEKHTSTPTVEQPASAWLVTDVLRLYGEEVAPSHRRPEKTALRLIQLGEWWQGKTLADVTGRTCRQYVEWRCSMPWKSSKPKDGEKPRMVTAPGARRELEDMRAAINWHRKEGLCREVVEVTLPPRAQPEERWLTREEVAKLLRTAWTHRERQHGKPTKRRPWKHLARFIVAALYTGSRQGVITGAALTVREGAGFVDMERGVFYRRPRGEDDRTKRRPSIRIPVRALSHFRRWAADRGGDTISKSWLIEYDGERIGEVNKGFASLVKAAGLGPEVTPHTLRHTAATWLMQSGADLWDSAGFLGMSVATLERVYGHHHPDHQRTAVENLGRRGR